MLLIPASRTVPAFPATCSLTLAPTYVFQAPTGAPTGKRYYLFHGLSSPDMWTVPGPPKDLVTGLATAGAEVVMFSGVPDGVVCFFSNGGWQYRTQFIAMLNAVKQSVEAAHGTATKNIVGGISYGGLHAMMAAITTGHFVAWFAHVPVTRIDALTEYSTVGNVAQFNPFYDVGSLKNTTGRISWGTADTRVNGALTAMLAAQLGSGVQQMPYLGETHDTTEQNVTDILSWAATL